MMNNQWVLVANGSRARVINAGDFEEVECLVNGEHRMREQELVSDRPGSFADEGQGKSSGETHHKEQALDEFARMIANYLESARTNGRLTSLSVIASPKFLGALRQTMKPPLRSLVAEEFDKDLTEVPIHELPDRITRLRG